MRRYLPVELISPRGRRSIDSGSEANVAPVSSATAREAR
jgi:hypothetical protein